MPGDDKCHKENDSSIYYGTACRFMDDLVTEIEVTLSENNPALVAFKVFNVNIYPSKAEHMEQFRVLKEHYGKTKVDTYDNHETQSASLISGREQLIDAEIRFSKFDDMKKQAIENLKTQVKRLITVQKLKQADMEEFLAKNQPNQEDVYSAMYLDGCLSRYPNTIKSFKFALLIRPTTSEDERGFSTVNLLISHDILC